MSDAIGGACVILAFAIAFWLVDGGLERLVCAWRYKEEDDDE
jgi:hypothetical protein